MAKQKIRCKNCSSDEVIKKGARKGKLQVKQVCFCKSCGSKFTLGESKNKTYPTSIILKSVSIYNLGYDLNQTRLKLEKSDKIKIPISTVSSWINEYKSICTFTRLRKQAIKLYKPKNIIHKQTISHIQPYTFKYHKAKLDILTKETPKFSALKDCIDKITSNKANELAKLALNLAKNNSDRHTAIQDFMLINDSTTIAVEVPAYLTNWDAGYYRNQKGFIFPLSNYQTPITGHIDILQIRNGLLHILDYKPDANIQKPIEQLTLYALALSRKLNLPLYCFKCAWFDENNYYEFFPLHAVYEKSANKNLVMVK